MTIHKDHWIDGMYLTARDYAHELIRADHKIDPVYLESEVYNYMMTLDSYRKYWTLVEKMTKKGVQRALAVKKDVNPYLHDLIYDADEDFAPKSIHGNPYSILQLTYP